MKHTIFRATAAVALAASAFGLVACSTSESTSDGPSTTTSAAGGKFEGSAGDAQETGAAPSTPEIPNLAKPTVAELNDKITKAFDPTIDAKTKVSWIEDAGQDPELVAKLVDAAKKNDVKVEVISVPEPVDGKIKADAKVTIGGAPVDNATVEFVAEDNQWKVDHQFACRVVRAANLNSAACQDE